MKIVHVVGARPNFVKIAPIIAEMNKYPDKFEQILVHTGQHYDVALSRTFFDDLGLPEPNIHLHVGSGSHAVQTAQIMIAFEPVLLEHKPDLVIVVGDVNSTMACALVASKLWIPVAHIEAGLRSFDRQMPEEINRIVTDSLSSLLFTTDRIADVNLQREGIAGDKVHFVGNVMIDTLMAHRDRALALNITGEFGVEKGEYAVLTLHRPHNVDSLRVFSLLIDGLEEICSHLPVVFPVHPRTRARIAEFGMQDRLSAIKGLKLIEPLGYLRFLALIANACFVLSDSGGVQEETTILGIPCLTLRDETERPITVEEGTNLLVGSDIKAMVAHSLDIIAGKGKNGRFPALWDGQAAARIVKILSEKAVSQRQSLGDN